MTSPYCYIIESLGLFHFPIDSTISLLYFRMATTLLLLSLLLLFCFWLLSHNLCETVGKWSGIGVTSATTALLSLCLLVTYLGHYFVQLVSAPTFTVSMEALIKSVAILRKKKKTIIAVR